MQGNVDASRNGQRQEVQEIDEDAYRRFEAVLEGGLKLPGDSTPRTLLKAKNKAGPDGSAPELHDAYDTRKWGLTCMLCHREFRGKGGSALNLLRVSNLCMSPGNPQAILDKGRACRY